MFRIKLGSLLALLAGPFILFMNYQETNEKKQIDREGIQTIGIPTSKIEKRGRKGGSTYKLELLYRVEGGDEHAAQVDVSHELYDKIDSEPVVGIKYLKENPSKLIVIGEPLESPEMNYVGGAVLLFGLGGTWWFFIRKKSVAQVPEPANA